MEFDADFTALWDYFVVGSWEYLSENPEAMQSVGIIVAVVVFLVFAFTRKKKS